MGYDFNASDIFEVAEQIERNGAEFYRTYAQKTSDSETKKLLLDLAGMEEEHEKIFADMRAGLEAREKTATVFDPHGESGQYLRALADIRVFYKKEIHQESIKEVLKSAIDAEKDSIVFYLGMKDMVPENQGKRRVDDIIREEMGHIILLSKKLSTIQ